MIIYRTSFHDADEGTLLSWHATKREADAALKQLIDENGESTGVERVDRIEIVNNKDALLRWLNLNFKKDNG